MDSSTMDHSNNSAKFDKEDLVLQKILKDVLGVTNRRPSAVRNDVLKRNLAKITKSTDLSSTNKCLLVTSKVVEEERKEENEIMKGTLSGGAANEKKSKWESLSRNKFNLKKVQLDVEIERLRRTVRKCHAALEPVQNYTDRRLEYYHSISNKESQKNESPKRKYKEDKSEDEEILKKDSCEYEYNGEWTCEVDGVTMKFRRINE